LSFCSTRFFPKIKALSQAGFVIKTSNPEYYVIGMIIDGFV